MTGRGGRRILWPEPMPRPCLVLRVFTKGNLGGNHLGVVTDLVGLETADMQRIAADLGFSETVFIDSAADEVPTVRIFTPGMEMPFAGHPLVGAASVMLDQGVHTDRLRCGIGEVAIRRDGDVIWVDAPMIPKNAQVDDSVFAHRVGLAEPLSTWRVAMPLDYRMVELATAEQVAAVKPDTRAFEAAHGLTVYARCGDRVRMRFFIPEAGIDEDPATGSAAVALATMYAARGEAEGRLIIDRPSQSLQLALGRRDGVDRRHGCSSRGEGIGNMTADVRIRSETAEDAAAIYDLVVAAFDGRTEEADLVDALREDGDLILSLVAVTGAEIVGHVAFSRVTIESEEGTDGGVVLAPVGVEPGRQGQEVGSRLINAGLEELRRRAESVVVVVGNPTYYARFGFSVDMGRSYPNTYGGSHFMALALVNAADAPVGAITYPDAFALVS